MAGKKIQILILEDNPGDAKLLQRELKKAGFIFTSEVVQTRTTYENALENFKPDIILSDYSLPSFNGGDAFRIKQKKSPDTPFIIVSGIIGEENAVELIKSGVTDYVLKDKLFSLAPKITRALNEAQEKKEKNAAGERLKIQNKKLQEIAFMQSHQMRAPVANVLGLFNLFKFDNPSDPVNLEIMWRLKTVAESLDGIINDIVKKTNDLDKC